MRLVKALRSSAFCHPLGLALLVASTLLAVAVSTLPQLAPLSGRAVWLFAVGVLSYLATIAVVLRAPVHAHRSGERVPVSRPMEAGSVPAPLGTATESGLPGGLTLREVEVLRMIASGLKAKEIADQLCVEESTVRRHTQNIYDKIDAQNIADATRWYIANFGFPKPSMGEAQATVRIEPREKRTQ